MVGNRAAGIGTSGTNVNKQQLNSNPILKTTIFSSCALFAIRSTIFKEKESLFSTVKLPHIGFFYSFKPYTIPYEWVIDKKPSEEDADQSQFDNRKLPVKNYFQNNIINLSNSRVFYRLIKNKAVKDICKIDVLSESNLLFSSYFEKTKHVIKNTEKEMQKGDVPDFSFKTRYINNFSKFTSNENIKTCLNTKIFCENLLELIFGERKLDKKYEINIKKHIDSTQEVNLFESGGIKNDYKKNIISPMRLINEKLDKRCLKSIIKSGQFIYGYIDKSAFSSYAKSINEKLMYIDNISVSNKNSSVNWQRKNAQQAIEVFSKNSAASQQENRTQFSVLQQQFKNAEQQKNREVRRLQQSMSEIKNMLSAQRSPVLRPAIRPPSYYGRIK